MPTLILGQSHSYKYYKPSALDNGVEYAATIETFMEKMANHTHNGDTSSEIVLSLEKQSINYVSGVDISWVPVADGIHKAIITMSNSNYDDNVRLFFTKIGGNWIPFNPKTEKINASTYYIYSNQPTQDLRVVTI